MIEDIKKITEEYAKKCEEIYDAYKEQAGKLFAEGCKFLFDKYPIVESFGWRQYTPYFNDGEECIFGVCADYDWGLEINGEDLSDTHGYKTEAYELAEPMYQEFSSFIYSFDENLLKRMFDDHVKITVTREGVITEGYAHE